jgi:hypothetical protein
VRANDTKDKFWRITIAVVLANDSGIVIADKSIDSALVLKKLAITITAPKRPVHVPQDSQCRTPGGPSLSACLIYEIHPPMRVEASLPKVCPSFVGYGQRTPAKVLIDINSDFTQSIQDGSSRVLIREVEAFFAQFETGFQKGYGNRKLFFLGVINYAKMFVQTQPAHHLGDPRIVGVSVNHSPPPVFHRLIINSATAKPKEAGRIDRITADRSYRTGISKLKARMPV